MFKRSRIKIVAIIMTVSFVLIASMMCIIYAISYKDMYRSNQEMLERYITDFYGKKDGILSENENIVPIGNPRNEPPRDSSMDRPKMKFELSTFYSVKYDKNGNIFSIDNNDGAIYSEGEIITLAEAILDKSEENGIYKEFSYAVSMHADGCMVVFMDNTIEMENFMIIIRYTMVFGGITLVIIFFLSCFLANMVVKPLEQNAIKQKQFISDAGHELKTPIAVVCTNLEMLNRQMGDNKWLKNIEYETEKMSALIKQLMELAKTENMTPPMTVVDLSHLVEGEILVFETVAFEQGIMLDYENVKRNVMLKGNSEQLKQLVAILLDNAIEHSADKTDVRVSLQEQKNRVVLAVANKGIEIPMDQREHLFERFYRGDYSRNSEGNHYGLGLAIAKAITETHKGSMKVICEHGYVIFEVQLPIK